MHPTTIIKSNPDFGRFVGDPGDDNILYVAELFANTIQGENFVGFPATFLRLKGCTLNCSWCDSKEVWRFGNPYSIKEILDLFEQYDLPAKFKDGQHLVLTGGSPLKQEEGLINLIYAFVRRFGFKPFIEVENEVVLQPTKTFSDLVDCWNNSPKLQNSGMHKFSPSLIDYMANLQNSWFKFVVSCQNDWDEIEEKYLTTKLISKKQIVLMPQGATREELEKNRPAVIELALKYNVRYTSREHIVLWDKKTGV